MKAVIIASGNISNYDNIRNAASGALFVICADGGASHAREMGITPDFIVGDLDSIDSEALGVYQDMGVEFEKYPSEKDCSDTEIALEKALQLGADKIQFIGVTGERADHTLSNIGLLYNCHKRGINATITDENNSIMLIGRKTVLTGMPGQTVSLLPFTEEVLGITTEGLYYPLNNESLRWGTTRGISNVFVSEKAVVDVKSGLLLVIIPILP